MKLVERPVAELEGPLLSYFVAIATGSLSPPPNDLRVIRLWMTNELTFKPATSWASCGPLIEELAVSVLRCDDDYGTDSKGFCNNKRIPVWCAVIGQQGTSSSTDHQTHDEMYQVYEAEVIYGPTPLIAACRAIVASQLGNTVQVPEELVK